MSTKFMTGLTLTALAALGLAAAHPAAAQTTVTLATTYFPSQNGGPYSLTTGQYAGTTDWINYGNYGSNAVNRKGTSTTIVGNISVATAYGSGAIATNSYNDAPRSMWTDGTSLSGGTASTIYSQDDRQTFGTGNGFTYTLTLAPNSIDTVDLFVGGYQSNSDLQVSAGSSQLVNSTLAAGGNGYGGILSTQFTNASNSSQLLTYNFFEASSTTGNPNDGNVKLADVTLSSSPIPSAAPEPSQSASLGFTVLAVMGLILKARKRRSQGEAV